MTTTLALSDLSRYTAGVMLLTIVTIEFGGWFLTKISSGEVERTEFQKAFARAGHGHAGALVTLGLVCLVLADASGLSGFFGWVGRLGVPLAAVLMSAGFFASSATRGATGPTGAVWILWAGVASLGIGVVTLGLGLLFTA